MDGKVGTSKTDVTEVVKTSQTLSPVSLTPNDKGQETAAMFLFRRRSSTQGETQPRQTPAQAEAQRREGLTRTLRQQQLDEARRQEEQEEEERRKLQEARDKQEAEEAAALAAATAALPPPPPITTEPKILSDFVRKVPLCSRAHSRDGTSFLLQQRR
jgi:hypothetical protein